MALCVSSLTRSKKMDLVLHAFDEACLDSIWAWAHPLRVPLDADVPRSASAATAKLLGPTAHAVANAARKAWPSASAAAYDAAASVASADQWTTVSAWPRDDIRRQAISVRGGGRERSADACSSRR